MKNQPFKMRPLFLFIFIGSNLTTATHSARDIGFEFIHKNNQNVVEVSLTSQTIIDLLYTIRPDLKEQTSLNLSQYHDDYEAYFNQHIELLLNGKKRRLKLTDANLIVHEASIHFLIEDFQSNINSYSITIGGFDFYQKPRFIIHLLGYQCVLDKQNNRCRGHQIPPKTRGFSFTTFWAVCIYRGVVASLVSFF